MWLSDIACWLIIIIAVEAITEIIIDGTIFDNLRDRIFTAGLRDNSKQPAKFIASLFSCGYCFSVWTASLFAWVLPGDFTSVFIIDYVIKLFALHRLSNMYHEFVKRWIDRVPFLLSIQVFKDDGREESDE